jgi:hypothetical protein
VLKRLNAEKAALVAAKSQTVAVAPPQHRTLALTAASKVLIDTFADAYVGASLAARKMLIEYITAAASGDENLGSTTWTASSSTVHARLKAQGQALRQHPPATRPEPKLSLLETQAHTHVV